MTQEEKSLLLQDLCARLPYGIKVQVEYDAEEFDKTIEIDEITMIDKCGEEILLYHASEYFSIEEIKPYLRPMSSITKEEREEIEVLIFGEWYDGGFCKVDHEGWIEILAEYDVCGIDPGFCSDYTDWLLEHHFDIRGLIEKGLALEVPKGMYETNEK